MLRNKIGVPRAGGDGSRPLWRRRWVLVVGGAAAPLVGVAFFLLWPFWKLSSHFEEITFRQPSRLYGQPPQLTVGRPYPLERVVKDLGGEGYREDAGAAALAPGRYRVEKDALAVHLRSF